MADKENVKITTLINLKNIYYLNTKKCIRYIIFFTDFIRFTINSNQISALYGLYSTEIRIRNVLLQNVQF